MRRQFSHGGRQFTVARGVFDPVRHLSGIAFADALPELLSEVAPNAQTAIDLGTGCGLLAATLADHGCTVTATDVSKAAVRCAHRNCKGLDVDVRHGDLFDPVPDLRVDVLVVNPPYERRAARTTRGAAFSSPNFLERLAAGHAAIADRLIVGFPADDADVLRDAGLDVQLVRTCQTAGAPLGIFIC